jgi:hypothetical protein
VKRPRRARKAAQEPRKPPTTMLVAGPDDLDAPTRSADFTWSEAVATARHRFTERTDRYRPPTPAELEVAAWTEYRIRHHPSDAWRQRANRAVWWLYEGKATGRILANGQVAWRWRGIEDVVSARLCDPISRTFAEREPADAAPCDTGR